MGFLDLPHFDVSDPVGRALLTELEAIYPQAAAVQRFVADTGLGLAEFSWLAPMSQVWPVVLSKAASQGRLRALITKVAEHPDSTAYPVIDRLVREPLDTPTSGSALPHKHPYRPPYFWVWLIWGSVAALIFIVIVPATWSSPGKSPPRRPHVTPQAVKATKTVLPATRHSITYIVRGSGSADITYGPEGSTLTGTVPMHRTVRLGNAAYYSLGARLEGSGGSVTVEISVDGKVFSKGTADGAYNETSAQIGQGSTPGQWVDDNSG